MGLERKQLMMVGVMLFGAFLVVLNQTLLSPAIPTIMIAFGIDAPTAQWLMSGYSLVEAIVIPLSAFFLGRFSTRKLFLAGFSLFAIGSLMAAWGPAFSILLLARVFQAVGTGIVMPMVITVILLVFPREKRGAAMGLVGLIIGFAPAIGPAASGVLVDCVGWHALFVIVSALAILVIVMANFALQDYGNFERTSLDVLSIVLSTVGLFCLLYGLSSFSSSPNILLTIGLIVVGFVVLGLFVRRQLHLDNPMLQVTVLKTAQYRIAIISVVILEAILLGTASYLPLFIQNVCGFSATISGFIMLPAAVVGAAMSMLSGKLFDKYGARGVVVGGCAATLVGGVMMYMLPVTAVAFAIILADIVMIFGIQTAMTPLNTWGVNSLDNRVIQHANALSNTLNQVAASFGTALLVSVSAMGQPISTEAAFADQMFVGYRLAFGVDILLALVLVVIAVVYVRDKAVAKSRVRVAQGEGGEEDELLVSSAMDVDAPFIENTATIREALFEIARNDTSGVPIVDGSQRVVGFISDGDIMGYLGRDDSSVDTAVFMYKFVDNEKLQTRLDEMLEKNVMELATKRVISVESTMDLGDACHVLADRRIKKVPVVDDGKLVGSLSRHNVILGIVEHLPA